MDLKHELLILKLLVSEAIEDVENNNVGIALDRLAGAVNKLDDLRSKIE